MPPRPLMKDLLRLALEHPEDDAPRSVWADAVGGTRGELVQVQCELARLDGPVDQRVRLRRREREILLGEGVTFAALEGLADQFLFRRGFVEWASVDATMLVERGEELLAAAPFLNALRVEGLLLHRGDPVELVARVISHPILRRVQALSLGSVGTETWTDNDNYPYEYEFRHAETTSLLAKSGLRLRELEADGLRVEPGLKALDAIRALLEAGVIAEVQNLVTTSIGLLPLEAFPRLTRLVGGAGHCKSLPATLRELRISGLDDERFVDFASSPAAHGLRRLQLHHSSMRRDASAFSAFASLRSLDLGDTKFGLPGYAQSTTDALATFTALQLPSLRELRLPKGLSLDHLRSIALAFGPQLELLDLRGQSVREKDHAELAALVAGEVRFGPWVQPRYPLLGAQPDGEPWIGVTFLPAK